MNDIAVQSRNEGIILDSILESVNNLRPPHTESAFGQHSAGDAHPDSRGNHGARCCSYDTIKRPAAQREDEMEDEDGAGR